MTESNDRLDRIEKILEEFSRDISRGEQERLKSKQEEQERQKRIDEQLGKISNAQGYLVEGLIAPAIPNIFREMGITEIYRRARNRLNGESMEVDVIGPGKDKVIVCEIQSRLRRDDVDDILNKLHRFTKFFPRYKGLKIIGLVAGVNIDEDVDKYAEENGLYVLGSSGDAVALLNKKTFKPRYF